MKAHTSAVSSAAVDYVHVCNRVSTSPLPKTLRLFPVLSTSVSAAFNVFCMRAHSAAACGGFICVALSVFGKPRTS